MVSNLAFSCVIVHDGVMRRSVAREGPSPDDLDVEDAVDIITDTSAGVDGKDILMRECLSFWELITSVGLFLVSFNMSEYVVERL